MTIDYSEQWTQHRAMLHNILSPKSLLSYRPTLEANARSRSYSRSSFTPFSIDFTLLVVRSFAQRLIAQPVNDLKFARDVFGGFIMQV